MALRHTGEPTHPYGEIRSYHVFRLKYWWMDVAVGAEHKDGLYWKVDIPFKCSASVTTDPDGVARITLDPNLNDVTRVVLLPGLTWLEPDDDPEPNPPEPQPEPEPEPEPEPQPEPVPVPPPPPSVPSLHALTTIREAELARYRVQKTSAVIDNEGLTNLPIIKASGIPGAWQVAGVIHLPGDINKGNRSIFVTAIDETTTRPTSLQLYKGISGGPLSFDRIVSPNAVLGAEVPLKAGETVSVAIGEVSDVVDNITCSHPATTTGNPQDSHSFYIIFIRRASNPEPEDEARLAAAIGTLTSHAIAHWRLYGGAQINTSSRVSVTSKNSDVWRIIGVQQVDFLHGEVVYHVRDASEDPLDEVSVKNMGNVIDTAQVNAIVGARIELINTGPYVVANEATITFSDTQSGYIVVVQHVLDLPAPEGPARIIIIERGAPGIIKLGPPEDREVVFWAREDRFSALWDFLVNMVEGGIPNE